MQRSGLKPSSALSYLCNIGEVTFWALVCYGEVQTWFVNGEAITANVGVVERLQTLNPCKASDMALEGKKDLRLAPHQSPSPYPVPNSTLINPRNTKVHLRGNMGEKTRGNRMMKANPETSKYSTFSLFSPSSPKGQIVARAPIATHIYWALSIFLALHAEYSQEILLFIHHM